MVDLVEFQILNIVRDIVYLSFSKTLKSQNYYQTIRLDFFQANTPLVYEH